MVGLRGPLATAAPNDLVSQVFDEQIWCTDERAEELVEFTEALIGLKRKDFLASMRSMRTYVTALHRLGEDPELAYMLLVASIESLAADFDSGAPNWDEYPEETRLKVDRALEGADGDLAEKVRSALLEVEHKSLGRRYRSFVLEHLTPSYFRGGGTGPTEPGGTSRSSRGSQEVLRVAFKVCAPSLRAARSALNEVRPRGDCAH